MIRDKVIIAPLCTLLKPLRVCYTLNGLVVEKRLAAEVSPCRYDELWIWNGAHSSRLITTSALDQALGSNVQLIEIPHGVGILEHL